MTALEVATQIAKDRGKWLTKQFKHILPNRLFCIVRNHQDGYSEHRMFEVENYLEDEKITIDVSPLDARIYKKGRLISLWRADIKVTEPDILPVKKSIIITDGDEP